MSSDLTPRVVRGRATFVLVAAVLALSPALTAQDTRQITAKGIGVHLDHLAGRSLDGRRAGSSALKDAAQYIAKHFESIGLQPGGDDGTFLRSWPMRIQQAKADACEFSLVVDGERQPFALGTGWMPTLRGAQSLAEGEPVFCGYGIEAKEYRYDDFAGIALRGKVAIVLWSEPRHDRKGKTFEGEATTRYSDYYVKAAACEERGAVGVIVVPAPLYEDRDGPLTFELPRMAGPPPGPGGGRGRRGFGPPEWNLNIPVVTVSSEVGEKLLGESPKSLQKKLDARLRVPRIDLSNRSVRMKVELETVDSREPNVVGIRPGTDDPLKDEYVLVGAHFDHEGRKTDGEIFAGADDNASGTSVMLELAQAFSQVETRRTIVFVAFSGEERGLLGSKAYAEAPHTTLDRCIVMLNLDMVGRGNPREVQVGGTWDAPDLEHWVRAAAASSHCGLELDLRGGKDIWQRSDQYSFFSRGVPALFFFAGFHDDYHKTTDTPDKIDRKKAERIGRLAFQTCFDLAEDDKTPRRPR